MFKFVVKDKVLHITYSDKSVVKISLDQYRSKSITTVAEEVNKMTKYFSKDETKKYIDSLKESISSELAEPLLVCLKKDLHDSIVRYVKENGFKLTETGRTSIFVTQKEIDELHVLACKTRLALPLIIAIPKLEDHILKELGKDVSCGDKLYKLVRNKLAPFKLQDETMWRFMKMTMFDDIETYALYILAFIQRRVLMSCQVDKNPIVYIISVAGECIKWMTHQTGPLSTDQVKSNPVFTFTQSKSMATIGQLRNVLLSWFKPEPLLTEIENASIISPVQDIWIKLIRKVLPIKRVDASAAAIISIFCAKGLQNIGATTAKTCPYLMTISTWIPKSRLNANEHVNEARLLENPYYMYGVNVRHLVADEIKKCKQNFLYVDPFTGAKNLGNFKALQNDLVKFMRLFTEGVVLEELQQVVDKYVPQDVKVWDVKTLDFAK